jgi:hypothetical protein
MISNVLVKTIVLLMEVNVWNWDLNYISALKDTFLVMGVTSWYQSRGLRKPNVARILGLKPCALSVKDCSVQGWFALPGKQYIDINPFIIT